MIEWKNVVEQLRWSKLRKWQTNYCIKNTANICKYVFEMYEKNRLHCPLEHPTGPSNPFHLETWKCPPATSRQAQQRLPWMVPLDPCSPRKQRVLASWGDVVIWGEQSPIRLYKTYIMFSAVNPGVTSMDSSVKVKLWTPEEHIMFKMFWLLS